MACQFESKIFELDELPSAERALVQEHMAQCAECRELARLLKEADACLQRSIRVPKLSPQFSTRLHERIARVSLTESEREQRKHQAQEEYQAELARLRRSSWNVLQILDGLGWVALALVTGWMVSFGLVALVKNYPIGGTGWVVGTGVLAVVLFAVGLVAAFSRQTRHFWG